MKRLTIILWIVISIGALLTAGCNSARRGGERAEPATSEPEYASKLRAEAKARGLKWAVVCRTAHNPRPGSEYLAYAGEPDAISKYYIEDGAKPEWIVSGATQQEAASKLLEAIQQPPNHYPGHRYPEKEKPPVPDCAPDLRGAPEE